VKIVIDSIGASLTHEQDGTTKMTGLYTEEAFGILSDLWLRVGWSLRYSYSLTWLGRPVIQLPEDLLRIQEVVFRVRPDVIVETGIAHGGSLVFFASLCRLLDKGHVVGVDIEIRSPNRDAIEAHPLSSHISLIEGDSAAQETAARVSHHIRPGDVVLVVLDSCHTRAHVLAELTLYAPLVSPGSYIVAADGIMADLAEVPGGRREWAWDNPREAAREFVAANPNFVIEELPFLFNEGSTKRRVTYWPNAFIKRLA